MRSLIAALRSLTLPWGATSGGRIVLDGVNGLILIYDSSGNQLVKLSPSFGFEGFDTSGNVRVRVSSPFGGAYSGIQLWTASAEETAQGLYTLADFGPMNRLVITPGEVSSKGSLEWTICSAPHDDSIGSLLQAVALTLNDAGNLRPTVDLTGAAAPSEAVQPHTVMYRAFIGTPNSYGEEPTKVDEIPRLSGQAGAIATPKILAGTTGVQVIGGTDRGETAVTFADAFAAAPSVVLGFRSASGTRAVETEATLVTTTGMTLRVRASAELNFGSTVTYNVSWIAVGEAPIP